MPVSVTDVTNECLGYVNPFAGLFRNCLLVAVSKTVMSSVTSVSLNVWSNIHRELLRTTLAYRNTRLFAYSCKVLHKHVNKTEENTAIIKQIKREVTRYERQDVERISSSCLWCVC